MKQRRFLFLVTFLCIITSRGFGIPAKSIRSAVLAEVKKYPKLEIQDLYKLAYEAAMGNEHIMGNTDEARKYLNEELASIDTSSNEALIEYLFSDSTIARINLHAFKARNGNPEKLFDAMTKTAASIQPSTQWLRMFLGEIESLAANEKIPFKLQGVKNYFREMEQKKFPAVHHSKIVEERYHPSYRVVNVKWLSIQ
jgi:hypothetical protein